MITLEVGHKASVGALFQKATFVEVWENEEVPEPKTVKFINRDTDEVVVERLQTFHVIAIEDAEVLRTVGDVHYTKMPIGEWRETYDTVISIKNLRIQVGEEFLDLKRHYGSTFKLA